MAEAQELDKRDWIAGLEKGLRIIEAFNDTHPRLTASTAARRTGITRTAARRYLLTLQHLGYLESDGTLFWLTPRVLRLGWSYFDSAKAPRAVQPFLQRLSIELACDAFFVVLEGDEILFVARNGASRVQNFGFVLGSRVAANLASSGIVLLSCKSPEEVDRWLDGRKFIPYTPLSCTKPDEIRILINEARASGYSVLEQQLQRDRRGIAVPIRTHNGEVVGAISVSLPMGNETTQQAVARTLPLLREAEHSLLALL